ncbi:MAG: hypothetical protein JWP62_2578 [Blastococcus sp.]|nr:hypothetical protein [Blastococcus sp.]
MTACTHLDQISAVEPSTRDGCTECLAMGSHVGQTSHPAMQSFQPGETWRWCYPDQMLV